MTCCHQANDKKERKNNIEEIGPESVRIFSGSRVQVQLFWGNSDFPGPRSSLDSVFSVKVRVKIKIGSIVTLNNTPFYGNSIKKVSKRGKFIKPSDITGKTLLWIRILFFSIILKSKLQGTPTVN